jgi:hypothetical protein
VHSIALSKRIVQHAQSMEDALWRCHAHGRLRLDGAAARFARARASCVRASCERNTTLC